MAFPGAGGAATDSPRWQLLPRDPGAVQGLFGARPWVQGLCGIQGSGATVDTEDAQGQGVGTGEPSPVRKSFLQACRGDRFLRTGHESDVVPWVLERLGQASATAGIQTL